MIRQLIKSDIVELNHLPPLDWGLDYESFIKDFINDEFYYAFVKIIDNKIVGTGNVFLKGKLGWLANIIVDKNHRGKGLGFEMTKYLVDFLVSKNCETQLLIATELGETVYKKIGFRKMTDYQCFDSVVNVDYSVSNSIRDLKISDLESVFKMDEHINGENREHLLIKFWNKGVGYFDDKNILLAFYLPAFGRGLVLGLDEKAGGELLKLKHSEKGKRSMIPIENQEGINLLKDLGLKIGNKQSRMILGKSNNWNPQYIYSYAGGYCG